MSTVHPRLFCVSRKAMAKLSVGALLVSVTLGAATATNTAAKTNNAYADSLSFAATSLRKCQRHKPGHCKASRARLSRLRQSTRRTPVTTVVGSRISWRPVAGIKSYVLASKDPGKTYQYSVVTGTAVTPQALPGTTVDYWVRTNVSGSPWTAAKTISYPTQPEGAEPFAKGISENITAFGQAEVPQMASEIHDIGADWVRMDVRWKVVMPSPGVYDWSSFDQAIEDATAEGLHVLPILDYAPAWTEPSNAAAYAEFVAAAVTRYGPGTSANLQWFELWNEPYFSYAWSGKTPEPEAYARDVAAASEAAKKVAPSVKLLLEADYSEANQTGTSPVETSWIEDMFIAEPNLGSMVDGIAVHPYGDDPSLPLNHAGGWTDTAGQWAFQRIDTIREQFLEHNVDLPFWITEEGWSTWEVSEATQAANYSDLVTQVARRPWIRALFSYCLREYTAHPTDNESGFGLLKFGTWEAKPAYYTLREGFKTLS